MKKQKFAVRIDKKNFVSEKTGISYLQILILVLSIFAFSYIVYEGSKELEIVSAQTGQAISWACCPEDDDGNICQDFASDICEDECKESCIPSKCEQVSSCRLGCCFDNDEGLCTPNSPKQRCEQDGTWQDDAACNVLECRLGCCILGSDTQFITERRCEVLSAFYGFSLDFRGDIQTELECLALSHTQAVGACIIEAETDEGEERTCKFVTKQECLQLTGNSINFYENLLCTNPDLETGCEKTKDTSCLGGKDEVYFLDSCGNRANIYDASKVNDDEYWERVVGKSESCGAGSGNIENKDCGNCNFFLGSICGEGNAKYGNYICKDLNCNQAPYVVDAEGKILKKKDRVNGESWCVYDGYIGEGKDVVGSRHWKYYCLDGEVKIESCSDFRQEVCVEDVFETDRGDISNAACRVNRWRECLDYNNLAEQQGDKVNYEKVQEECEDNSDCYGKELDFGIGYKFYQCLAQYPGGFELKSERGSEINKEVCSLADFECIKVEEKKISGWKCIAGCDCTSKKYTQQMNDWCVSLGDCGGYVNIVGGEDKGYSVDNAPEIDLNQYQEYINPVEGQKAEPGDISEILEGMLGLGEEGYLPEDKSMQTALWAGGIVGLGGGALVALLGGGKVIVGGGVTGPSWMAIPSFGAPSGALAAFGNFVLSAAAGAVAGMLIAKIFGLQGDAAIIMVVGGALTFAAVSAITGFTSGGVGFLGCLGSGPLAILCLGIIIFLAIILKVLGIGEIRETHVQFNCYPWEAPTGGQDCEKCGSDLKECSRYRCSSLGQACGLVNEGTGNEECIQIIKNDATAPKISPWEEILSGEYKYDEVSGNGFKIKQENGDCIEAYTPLIFGIETNEHAQCKSDVVDASYENLQDYFGQDNSYKKEHSLSFMIPHPGAFAYEFNLTYEYVLDKIGEIRFYVKCQDANGNKNTAPYLIDICIKPGPDLTAPAMVRIEPASNSYVKFNADEQPVTLYINEPADCKWSLQDKKYEQMENEMECRTGLQDASLYGWTCIDTLPLEQETFYFRCKDQPWLAGTINESERNTNQQSYVYELKKSASELKITKIEPEKGAEIKSGNEPMSVTLTAYTSGGAESGKASCEYGFEEGKMIDRFYDSFSSVHKQEFNQLMRGTHTIYVKCEDVAGNEDEGFTNFKLKIDTSPPRIIRVYNDGILKIVTDEDAECVYSHENCNFIWQNATKMSGMLREHTAEWISGETYYVKCKDLWDNKPGGCSIIVKTV